MGVRGMIRGLWLGAYWVMHLDDLSGFFQFFFGSILIYIIFYGQLPIIVPWILDPDYMYMIRSF